MASLDVRDIHVWYRKVEAVRGISLSVADRECVGIVGSNGAGKTSLLRAISSLVPHTGSVAVDGKVVRGSSDQVVRSGITHVLEGRHIFCEMSVRENLQLAKFAKNDSTFNERLSDVLETFPILKPKLRSRGGDLSGGQQQILALARGLLTAPGVLLLDEPSLGLAPVVVEQLAGAIPIIKDHYKTTVLLAEQAISLVVAVADRLCVIARGEVKYDGPPTANVLRTEVLRGYFGESVQSEPERTD